MKLTFVFLILLVVCVQAAPAQSPASELGQVVSELGDKILVVFQDSKENYWFGGGEQGLYRYDGKRLIRFTKQDGLCSHSIVGIQEGANGDIFFDTTEGISKFDGQRFDTLQPVEMPSASEGWELNPDDLWFRMGWEREGPLRYDGKVLRQLRFPRTERGDEFQRTHPNINWSPYGVYSIFRDSGGTVWFGTASLGVCRFDGESLTWLYESHLTYTPQGGAFGIRSIAEDDDGKFWFCNSRFRYAIADQAPGSSAMKYERQPGVAVNRSGRQVQSPYFMSIIRGSKEDLWMVTYDEGVWRFDGKQLIHYPVILDGKPVLLFSMYRDTEGVIWLGSHEKGAFRLKDGVFVPFKIRK